MPTVRDAFATAERRAAFALLAAGLVSSSIAIVGIGAVGLRTIFYGTAALAQIALGLLLLGGTFRRTRLAAIGAVILTVSVTLAWRTVGIPAGVAGLRLLDATDAPLTAAGLQVVGLIVLLSPPRSAGMWSTGRLIRTAVATLITVVLTAVGVLSAASEVAAVRMSSGHERSVTDLREKPGPEPLHEFTLVAAETVIGGERYWTYNGTVPGPELRVGEGDRLRITLINRLPEATSIHWHGVSVPNAEDGVAGLTQDAVPPGGTYRYEFVVHETGTFWFHPHQDTFHQTLRGLFGALVVMPRSGLPLDRDQVVFLHEAFSGSRDALEMFGGIITGAPSGQAPAFNGRTGDLRIAARPGERVRLRVISALQGDRHVREISEMMRAAPQGLVLLGAPYRIVAIDGRDLSGPTQLGPMRLPIAIGQRYDLEFTMPPTGAVRLLDRDGGETVTVGDGAAPEAPDLGSLSSFDLLRYGSATVDPIAAGGHFDRTYQMTLGNHFGFHEGQLQLIHTINGLSDPRGTEYPVSAGEVVRFLIDNETNEFHSMHLHGHPFTVLERDNVPIQGSPVEIDSLLVAPRQHWEIAFRADNPGLWMFHCHVLIHASFGMVAIVSYPGIHSPFEMGTRSGNKPE